jgi:mono/diheme cytochrome c family protein
VTASGKVLGLAAFLLVSGSLNAADDIYELIGDAQRGKALYANQCVACHVSLVGGDGTALHTRPNRRVQTPEGLIKQVNACNHQLNAGLNAKQVDDLVAYLTQSFYKPSKQ